MNRLRVAASTAAVLWLGACGVRRYEFVDAFGIDAVDSHTLDGFIDTPVDSRDVPAPIDAVDAVDARDVFDAPDVCITRCMRGCTDLQTDPSNCGMCGRVCVTGASCVAGACMCPIGQTMCAGGCVDLSHDANNCGACGTACGPMGVCNVGVCGCSGGPAIQRCGGACVNTAADPLNCGGCGHSVCRTDVCVSGVAQCAPGYSVCPSGAGPCGTPMGICTNLSSDPTNCGFCGMRCPFNYFCSAGVCSTICRPPREQCGSRVCVDPTSDPSNCGGCGIFCSVGEFCANGSCAPYAPAPCSACPCPSCPAARPNCCEYPVGQAVCTNAPSCPPG